MLVTIQNQTSSPLPISFLYKTLAPNGETGDSVTVSKSYSELDQEAAFKALIVAGSVTATFAAEAADGAQIGITGEQVVKFVVGGALSTGTEQGGAWEAPAAGKILAVTAYRKTAGTAGSTIVDVNIAGTTIFTTQSNRPEIAYDDADGKASQTTIENDTFAAGELVTMDIDQVDSAGSPADLTVLLTVDYSA